MGQVKFMETAVMPYILNSNQGIKNFIHPTENLRYPGRSASAPRKSLSEKRFLCVTLCDLCVSVVKNAKEIIHHRGTEVAQRSTEFVFPTDSKGVPETVELISHPSRVRTNLMTGTGGLPTTGYYHAALRAAPPHNEFILRVSQISYYSI